MQTHSFTSSRGSYRRRKAAGQGDALPRSKTSIENSDSKWHCILVLSVKYEQLRALLRSFGSCLVAYSGGVDSVFLAFVARDVLGDKALAAIADSPSLPRREFEDAIALGRQF